MAQLILGIAAATPRGLVVPNIKGAHALTLPDLAAALEGLVATAREGRTPPEAMAGGTFTITNVGVFGVDGGTPIINPGESAILCFGQIADRPWVVDGALAVRKVATLTLSFDLMFANEAAYAHAARSPALRPAALAQVFDRPAEEIQVVRYAAAQAIKIAMPRAVVSGSPGDRDVYGAQQHLPLLALKV